MKLSLKAFALTCGLIWGGAVLLVGLCNVVWPTYGTSLLNFCSSIYPGYHVAHTVGSVVVATLYAVLDGSVGGIVFAWLYNRLAA